MNGAILAIVKHFTNAGLNGNTFKLVRLVLFRNPAASPATMAMVLFVNLNDVNNQCRPEKVEKTSISSDWQLLLVRNLLNGNSILSFSAKVSHLQFYFSCTLLP